MPKNLPVYELRISPEDESQVEAIALVDDPAIESDFIAFHQHKEFAFSANEERMELIGLAMKADMKIYRFDEQKGEYFVFFSKDTVRQIAQTFFKKNFQSNLNLDHSAVPANSYVFQSYIIDTGRGINSPKDIDGKDGDWVIGVKVEDKQVWEDIKAGKRKGFSVEGLFKLNSEAFNTNINKGEQELMDILKDISRLLNNPNK